MTLETILIALAVALVFGALCVYLGTRLAGSSTSTKEQALKALDKAAKVVAALNDPGPEEQAAAAARMTREAALQQSIAATMAKVSPLNPPAVQ